MSVRIPGRATHGPSARPAHGGLAAFAAPFVLATALAAPAPAAAQLGGYAILPPSNVEPINNLPNPYRTIRDWGTLPDGRTWGSVSALDVDVDGEHLWVADRCGANSCAGSPVDPIVKLDRNGNTVLSFGAGIIVWPHGMYVDREGNVWVADARTANAGERQRFPEWANRGNAVYKFSPTGELLLTLGTPGQMGNPPAALYEPNDVLVAPDGIIYVLEGHGGQFLDEPGPTAIGRVSVFAPDGTFLRSFGEWGTGPGQFRGPHAIVMDSQGRLIISDRGNRRIQIFDLQGNLLDTWFQFSRVSGLAIGPDDTLYAIDSESDENYNPGWRKGIRVGSARTGEVFYFVPEHMSTRASGMGGYGAMGEGIAVDRFGNMYSGEVGPIQGVTKYEPVLVH